MCYKNRDYLLVKISNGFQRALCTQTCLPWDQNIFYSPQAMLISWLIWTTESHVPRTSYIVSYKVRQAVLWMTPVYTSQVWSQDVNTNQMVGSERKKETKKGEEEGSRRLHNQQATDLLSLLVTKGKIKDGNQSHIYRCFLWFLQVKLVRTQKNCLKKQKQSWVHICVSIVSKPQKSCALFAYTPDKNKLGGRGKLLVHESTCIYTYILQSLM